MTTKYVTLKVTVKELAAIQAGVDTLSAMGGAFDESFTQECKNTAKAFDAVLKRNELSGRDFT